jgi:uncharacterized protein YuzE
MKLNYYPETDSLYIDLSSKPSSESREISTGINLDYDCEGDLVGIDIDNASKIWFDNDNLWVLLQDGRQLSVPLAYFPRLLNATPEQRREYTISGGGIGLHWDNIDEDISVPSLLMGYRDITNRSFI